MCFVGEGSSGRDGGAERGLREGLILSDIGMNKWKATNVMAGLSNGTEKIKYTVTQLKFLFLVFSPLIASRGIILFLL